ncbi:hypothetical protein KAK05_00470 [Candidatus Parcubacteria bacterium]|nr:hypothetical protein [Candidatus Parcubacteria bacterium]
MSENGKAIFLIAIMMIATAWIMFYPITQLSEISIEIKGVIALIINIIIYALAKALNK